MVHRQKRGDAFILPYLATVATTTIDASALLRRKCSSSPASSPRNHPLQLPRVQDKAAAQGRGSTDAAVRRRPLNISMSPPPPGRRSLSAGHTVQVVSIPPHQHSAPPHWNMRNLDQARTLLPPSSGTVSGDC